MSAISSAISSPLKLSGDVGDKLYYATVGEIEPNLRFFQVLENTTGGPQSIWLLYSVKDWGHHGDQTDKAIIAMKEDGVQNFGKDIKSIQGFDRINPGIFVFESFSFIGFAAMFDRDQEELFMFPAGTVNGVSSAIVTGGRWSFFTGYNFTGTTIHVNGVTEFGPGKIDFLHNLAGNNLAKSMKRVGA